MDTNLTLQVIFTRWS